MITLKTITQTRLVMILAVLFISTSVTMANYLPTKENNKLEQTQKVQLQTALNKVVDYPTDNNTVYPSGIVKAEVKVNKDGTLTVNEINGDPELTKHVQTQLNTFRIGDPALIGKTFIAKFDFRK